MKSSFKLARYISLLGSVYMLESAQAQQCPTLSNKELERLCRWEELNKLKSVPILNKLERIKNLQVGEITTEEGVTLTNSLDTCHQKDSLIKFFQGNPQKKNVGTFSPKSPVNLSKNLCSYDIQENGEKIFFEVSFLTQPPRPRTPPPILATPKPAPEKSPKTVGGYSWGDKPETGLKQVQIPERPLPPPPPPRAVLKEAIKKNTPDNPPY